MVRNGWVSTNAHQAAAEDSPFIHIDTIHFFICISHQSLNIFHRSKTGGSPTEQTRPIIRSDPTMAGDINLGAKNSSSEAFDTFSFLKVSEVCCGF